jgi:hypothetical protein
MLVATTIPGSSDSSTHPCADRCDLLAWQWGTAPNHEMPACAGQRCAALTAGRDGSGHIITCCGDSSGQQRWLPHDSAAAVCTAATAIVIVATAAVMAVTIIQWQQQLSRRQLCASVGSPAHQTTPAVGPEQQREAVPQSRRYIQDSAARFWQQGQWHQLAGGSNLLSLAKLAKRVVPHNQQRSTRCLKPASHQREGEGRRDI